MAEDNSFAGQGAVVLDIGDDIGALIVTMPADLEGVEIEIRPVGAADQRPHVQHAPEGSNDDPDHTHDAHISDAHTHDAHAHDHADDGHAHPASPWPHVAVVARRAPIGIVHSAVYPELSTGSYELYERPAGPVRMVADVVGGSVTEAVWPQPS